MSKWWENIDFTGIGENYELQANWGQQALSIHALREGKTVYDAYFEGILRADFEEFQTQIHKFGGRLAFTRPGNKVKGLIETYDSDTGEPYYPDEISKHVFVWDEGIVGVHVEDGDIEISIDFSDIKLFQEVRDYIVSIIGPKVSEGKVYVLTLSTDGPKLTALGIASVPFEPSNYSPEVVKEFEHIVSDLGKQSPCGRIVILDGVPGSGKTFCIRSLINEVKNALFIIIPANFIAELSSPQMVSALVNLKRGKSGVIPTIFIVEDADHCLVKRAEDNLTPVSSLLNFGDGIIGNLIDIRIICTTNAEIDDIDDAVVRPGRLCRRVEIGLLDEAQAKGVYTRITGKPAPEALKGYRTLAEVYKLAKDEEWELSKKSNAVGFSVE